MIDYNKRLVEVSEILKHLSKSDYNKIPKEIIDRIENNKDKEYIWNYDETKDLIGQNLNKDTIAILSYINMQYLLNEKQKKYMQEIFKENQIKIEELKRKKYSTENLFKNKKIEDAHINEESIALVKNKEKNFMQKLFDKIRNILIKHN